MITAYRIRHRNKEKLIQRGIRMDEKTMVADALVGINGELKMFGDMIPQTVPETDPQPVRNVSGEDVRCGKRTQLLRSGRKGNPGGN